jgi:hypothetical protein
MQVIDLVTRPELFDQFKEIIKFECSEDPLYLNYLNMHLSDFTCLTAVYDNDQLAALSGIQIDHAKWGSNIARVSSRFWIRPVNRIQSLSKYNPDQRFYFNSQLMIPYQLNYLKETDIKFAMITRRGNYRRSFGKFITLVNHHANTNFILLDNVYNVCEPSWNIKDECKQLVAVQSLRGDSFDQELVTLNGAMKLLSIAI